MLVCKISDRFGALNPALNAKNALHGNTIWPISIHPSQIGKIINIENDNLRENYYLNICTLTDETPLNFIFKDNRISNKILDLDWFSARLFVT